MVDLLQCVLQLGFPVVRKPPFHFRHYARAVGVQTQRNDTREAEPFAITTVQPGHALQFGFRQASKPKASLLAGGIGGETARARFSARELRVRAHQRELPFPRGAADRGRHRPGQLVERGERTLVPGRFRDPGRVLVDRAEARQPRGKIERIKVAGVDAIYYRRMLRADRIMQRCEALAQHSELAGGLTRVFLSPEARAANEKVLGWMREAGMQAGFDAIGNAAGRYEGERAGLPCLMLGSHLDTVRDAGKYDGMLGVISAIECVASLNSQKKRLPFAIEVIGFGDEEGVRFGTTLLGSRALAGIFDLEVLKAKDAQGKTMADALRELGFEPSAIPGLARKKGEVLAYAELHIEQGPVLEAEGLAVGVVTAINGFSRLRVTLRGTAGHAGTVPMNLRRDALAGAAECVLVTEKVARGHPELVGTVGRIEAKPGAINVIPGEVMFTVDVRAPRDDLRNGAVATIRSRIEKISQDRKLDCHIETLQEFGVTACSPRLMEQMDRAVAAEGVRVRRLPSGAGHDGMALGAITDICMLFVRCKGGVSHSPLESITLEDAAVGARVLERFISNFK
jgi:allantoate deiminase